jgi:hypothetical protein
MAPILEIQARLFFVDRPPPGPWLPQKTLLLHRWFSRDEPEVEEAYRLLCRGNVNGLVAFFGGISQEGVLAEWFLTAFNNRHGGVLCKYRQKQRELENMDRAIMQSFAAACSAADVGETATETASSSP